MFKNTNRSFNARHIGHNRLASFVTAFIAIVFVLMLAYFVFIGFVAYKVVSTSSDVGVKGMIEQVWCGKDTECKLPAVLKE